MEKLQINGLCKRYPGFEVQNVTFGVPKGAVVGLIGENGAGKSTVIKSILGAVHPDHGEILLDGKNIASLTKSEKQKLSFVLDDTGLPLELNLSALGAVMSDIFLRWDPVLYKHWLKRLDLPENKAVKTFSKGMKMKAAIAVALSYESEILVLDEPTSGLDPVVRDDILEILYDYMQNENHALLISSHITADLEKLCDYIIYLHQGKVLFNEEKDVLLERYAAFSCDRSFRKELDPARVEKILVREYGIDVLVRKENLPQGFQYNKVGLDELMLFWSKGENL